MDKAGAPVNAKAIFTIKSFFALMLQPSLEVALLIGSYSSTIKVHLYCNSKTHTCFNLKPQTKSTKIIMYLQILTLFLLRFSLRMYESPILMYATFLDNYIIA